MSQFSLRSLMLGVAICALQAFAYVQFELFDWLFANVFLGMALFSAYTIGQQRWRRLVLSWGIFLIALGFLIPAMPPNATSESKEFICTTCLSTKFVLERKRFTPGSGQGANSVVKTMPLVDVVDRTCGHTWKLRSATTRQFRYLFGLKLPSTIETTCARPKMLIVPVNRPGGLGSGS